MAEVIVAAWLGVGALGLVGGVAAVRVTARRLRRSAAAPAAAPDELLEAA